jgi:hypothetical protein
MIVLLLSEERKYNQADNETIRRLGFNIDWNYRFKIRLFISAEMLTSKSSNIKGATDERAKRTLILIQDKDREAYMPP